MIELPERVHHDGQDARLARRIRAGAVSAVCGTFLACEPPTLPADTAAKRLADRLLPRDGWPEYLYFIAVIGLWVVSLALAGSWRLAGWPSLTFAALASFVGGAWCGVNFWRCRHAHCVITGGGWLALTGLAAGGALLGRSLLGGFEGVVFLGVLAIGVVFEFGWYMASGTAAATSQNLDHISAEQARLSRRDAGPRP